jgi:hypothetical protein
MEWLEYNIHVRSDRLWYENSIKVLRNMLGPFVKAHTGRFAHWHYLIEPDKCRQGYCEIRVRFEAEKSKLEEIRKELMQELRSFSVVVMQHDELLGSHEGCHGERGRIYQGAASERFGRDWPIIVRIMEVGSEAAIEILQLAEGLTEKPSLEPCSRTVQHPYFLHLPANQLMVEP